MTHLKRFEADKSINATKDDQSINATKDDQSICPYYNAWATSAGRYGLCGCGRPVQYIVTNGDGTTDACNKYSRCPTWEELKASYDRLREVAWAFAEEPMDRNTYTLDHAKRKRLRDVLAAAPMTERKIDEST